MNAPADVHSPELEAIARQAQAIDGELAADLNPPDPTTAPPAPVDHVAEARDLIDFAHDALVPLYPSLATVYTEPVRDRIAKAGGKLLAKYGVTMADIFGAWGEEIGFALVVVPLVVPTVQAIRADRAAAEKAASAPPPPPPAPVPTADQAAMLDKAADEAPAAPNPLERFGQ